MVIKMIIKSFGCKIRTIRESVGFSQNQLSDLTGITREQISRIENGQVNMTFNTIVKLGEALQTPLYELFNFEYLIDNSYKPFKLKPFVKWAGGKTQILDKIIELLPDNFETYYEPFLGGGALFLYLTPKKAIVSDYNKELMDSFRCFQDYKLFSDMIGKIKQHEFNHSEEYYYKIRDMDRKEYFKELPLSTIAARMIYLNKACFNGLYRVNSKGYFNVPSGKKDDVKAYDEALFNNLHLYLKNPNIKLLNGDFEKAVSTAKKGDFVYFDPPYDVFENKNGFTTYTKNEFGKDEQKRLSDVFKKLDKNGVYVMLSNHNTNYIKELYAGYNINVVKARRNINSKGSGRGHVEEVIITNYEK
jgi:DNA adenine methylase